MAKRGIGGWGTGMACGAAAVALPAAALMLGALLLPGLVAWLLDRAPGRPTATTMILFGTAAALPALPGFWDGGMNASAALTQLANPSISGMAWMAGAIGWALTVLLPMAAAGLLDVQARSRLRTLRAARRKLEQSWDLSG